MKYEILKKTLFYRSFSFVLTMVVSTVVLYFFFNDILLSWYLSIFTEAGAVFLYYIYEYLWRRHISRRYLKKGVNLLQINGDQKVRIAYEVIEDLGEGKLIIEVV